MDPTPVRMRREHERIRAHLYDTILPFWLQNSPDYEFGGFYSCFDNTTHELVSTRKFLWAQGRMLWLMSELYAYDRHTRWAELAGMGQRFIVQRAFDRRHHCYFSVDRQGRPSADETATLYGGTFADCFVVLGLSAYARVFADPTSREHALAVFRTIRDRFTAGLFNSYPYPVPNGLDSHGVHMMIAVCGAELLAALKALPAPEGSQSRRRGEHELCHSAAAMVAEEVRNHLRRLYARFRSAAGPLREYAPGCGEQARPTDRGPNVANSILLSYHNPGHSLETFSLVHEQQSLLQGGLWSRTELVSAVLATLECGWDRDYGGLFTFVAPGRDLERFVAADDPLGSETMVTKVARDWSHKLWWPHAEAMYTALALGLAYDSQPLLAWYSRIRSYALATFPSVDGREWVQIRDRFGKPLDAVVALPVKDPYHIPRCLIKCLQAIERAESGSA